MRFLKKWRAALVVMVCVAVGVTANAYRRKLPVESSGAAAQDVITLDRRISMLEQRLTSIDSRISMLEQQSILSSRSTPSVSRRDPEIDLLRRQVEILQRQINELGCGLVKLDERTLPASARERRRRAGVPNTDPCRLEPETPLQLPTRP